MTVSVLILGASYGSLLATKLLMAGHSVTLVCTPPTAELINREGIVTRFPVRGREGLVSVPSGALPGALAAAGPDAIDPAAFDLAVLAMQEPQYGEAGVRGLLARLGAAGVPALAIMNMPPPPYLARLPGLDTAPLRACYADPDAWAPLDPSRVTLASPDPQAFRPPDEPKNVLQVSLPTNFKAAPFARPEDTALLRRLEADILAARFTPPGEAAPLELPVKLRVYDSLYVPLAKWPMLLAGNYSCITPGGPVPIERAVHADPTRSRAIYDWVASVCVKLGAAPDDLVLYEKYAAAAASLAKPSSAARALFGGATHIERVDALVDAVASQLGMENADVRAIARLADARLAANRAVAADGAAAGAGSGSGGGGGAAAAAGAS